MFFQHAWRMISEATDKLSQIAKDFAAIYQHATTFINGVNAKFFEEGIRLTNRLARNSRNLEEHAECKVLKKMLR
jgi:hypothetical protein